MRAWSGILVLLLVASCGGGPEPGDDGGRRGRVRLGDGGLGGEEDDASTPRDMDAGAERPGMDAGGGPFEPDGGASDSGPDGSGVGDDGGAADAGSADASSPDARPMTCELGRSCTSSADCGGGLVCQEEVPLREFEAYTRTGAPSGRTMSPYGGELFQGGLCTTDLVAVRGVPGFRTTCDPSDPEACGACGTCVSIAEGTLCLQRCEYRPGDRDVCRFGYACTEWGYCFDGCESDLECQVYWDDVAGDSGLEPVLDPALASARCDWRTRRCTMPGTPGATAGIPCTRNSQCEPDGMCFDLWPEGGYCSKLRCDVPGRACAGGGTCQARGFGIPACLRPCTVGSGRDGVPVPADDPAAWRQATGGCRSGYACWWDGVAVDSGAGAGGCVPGNFNGVSAPNVGAGCASDETCWSPFGLGACIAQDTGGYCTVQDCAAPGLPAGICGAGADCVTGLEPSDPAFGLCLKRCTTGTDCPASATCIAGDDGVRRCVPGDRCREDADCSRSRLRCLDRDAEGWGRCGR